MGGEDVRHAATRLRKLLRAIQFPDLHVLTLENGVVKDLLRVLHFVLLNSSRAVATFILDKGYDLYGKTDARFVESAFRLMRDEFRYFPSLSTTQFLSTQFVARRLELVADVAAVVVKKQQELQRQKRREGAVWSRPQEIKPRKVMVENHVVPAAVSSHAANILQQLQHVHAAERRQTRQTTSTSTTTQSPVTAPDRVEPSTRWRTAEENNVPSAREPSRAEQTYDRITGEDNSAQTESSQSKSKAKAQSCACSPDSSELKKTVSELSQQLSQLSSTLLGKISSVETRLERLETQLQGLQMAVEEQRAVAPSRKPTRHGSEADDLLGQSYSVYDARPETASPSDTQRSLHADSPCAWPPQPSVFERY